MPAEHGETRPGEDRLPHAVLLERCKNIITDFTCPISGLPTPDREFSRLSRAIGPLTICERGIWGVSNGGQAIKITQEYTVGNFHDVGDPVRIHHRGLQVDLHADGARRPVSILHDYMTASKGPQFLGYAVEALEPDDRWQHTLQSSPEVQAIAEQTLDTLTGDEFAWFVPLDNRVLSIAKVAFTGVGDEKLPLAALEEDSRIMVAPYAFAREEIYESLLVPVDERHHQPSSPGSYASHEGVAAMVAVIVENAADIHSSMASHGAIDISKLY